MGDKGKEIPEISEISEISVTALWVTLGAHCPLQTEETLSVTPHSLPGVFDFEPLSCFSQDLSPSLQVTLDKSSQQRSPQ